MRVAVETGWARARNTCLAADAVSLLAAVVLYIFAIGVVRGFAFALGISTLIDIAVFFWFTKPVMTLLARRDVLQQRSPALRPLAGDPRHRRAPGTTHASREGGPDGQDEQARQRALRGRRLDRLRRPQVALVLHLRDHRAARGRRASTSRASTSASSSRAASSTTSACPADQVTQDNVDKIRDAVADTGIDAASSPIVNTSGESIRVQTEELTNDQADRGHRRHRRGRRASTPRTTSPPRRSARAGASRSPSAP